MIKLVEVKKIYKMGTVDVTALNGVSLKIDQGEFIAIIGASGSGKSTMMNILGCLDVPTSGQSIIDDQNVEEMSGDQLAEIRNNKIGFVFQTFNLLSRQTALSNVLLPLMYSNEKNRKSKSQAALEKVGLGDRIHHKPTQLSGGQQQRVAIARALVNNPDILLADEPTGNLDSTATEEIISIFKDLNENEGITVIMVTHEEEIAGQAQRIISMKDGLITSDKKTI
jgi:putative ABC transport system ATP-binding protein|tara:strand:- start:261 stop:935 length:675 start_codon:yes stop_codon:yes gene_type:complete